MSGTAGRGANTKSDQDLKTSSVPSIAEGLIAAPPQDPGAAQPVAPAGAVVVIIEGDHKIVSTAGVADIATQETMTPEHAHDLASVSKLITVLSLQRLFSLGEITPEHTLGNLFGAIAGSHQEVTVDDLLRHRSGMREWWPLYVAGTEAEAALDPVSRILGMPPRYPRPASWHYSDLGMQLAGAIIAAVTGLSCAEAARELVLEPLGASTVTAGLPAAGAPVATGPRGDAIEHEMVTSHIPYPVDALTQAAATEFPWRTKTVRGEVADCNAFHAFNTSRGQVAGHAGWFGDAEGMLTLAQALIEPETVGIAPEIAAEFARPCTSAPDAGDTGFTQGRGARLYPVNWRGQQRIFRGHPGFTGTFVAAAPATADAPAVRAVMLTNRLHANPPPTRKTLISVDQMWHRSMSAAQSVLYPTPLPDTTTHSDPVAFRPKRTGGAP